jgi:hypothetical protein
MWGKNKSIISTFSIIELDLYAKSGFIKKNSSLNGFLFILGGFFAESIYWKIQDVVKI